MRGRYICSAVLLVALYSAGALATNALLGSAATRADLTAAASAQARVLQPTKFLISNFGEQASGQKEVTYDECGQPLCPGRVVMKPPPAAYVCDCTRADAHPDCGCGNGVSNTGATCNCAPGERCPCNAGSVVGANFVSAPSAAPRPEVSIVKGFKPAMEPPAPLPDPEANQCKPNVFGVGPGTCKKVPVSRVCAASDANCLFNTGSIAYAQAPARVQPAGCQCAQPAPAPCNCVTNPATGAVADVAENLIGDDQDRQFMEELKQLCKSQPSCQLPNTPTAAEAGALALESNLVKNEVNTFKDLFSKVQQKAATGSVIEQDILKKGLSAMQSFDMPSSSASAASVSGSEIAAAPLTSSSGSGAVMQPMVSGVSRSVPTVNMA